MNEKKEVSRRGFIGGVATALTYAGVGPGLELMASPAQAPQRPDGYVKISNNENPYGPSDGVRRAMTRAFEESHMYVGSNGITQAIADHHGLETNNLVLGAGSTETLKTIDDAFLKGGGNIIGTEPTFETTYRYLTNTHAEGKIIPLTSDYRHDLPAMAEAIDFDTRFVYICNPNNPTGTIVTDAEIREFLDSIPENMVVVIDEAYHHFVENPRYDSAIKYVKEGRNVIVTRTFSKVYGIAGLRLGYGIAKPELISQMRSFNLGSINVIAKSAGIQAFAEPEVEARVIAMNSSIKKRVIGQLTDVGYEVIPSEGNFFMVNAARETDPIRRAFREHNVEIGRRFPPMDEHLRISVGTDAEMDRFMEVWMEVMGPADSQANG
jgi:histidinol-phosphate aminotransferase